LIQENNFEQRKKNVNVEGRGENQINDNFSSNFNREARDCKKGFENNTKGKEGKFNKNKFGVNENNERKRIGSEKEYWECGKERPVGISGQAGKQGVVEFCGVSSAGTEKSSNIFVLLIIVLTMLLMICCCDVLVTNQSFFRIDKEKC